MKREVSLSCSKAVSTAEDARDAMEDAAAVAQKYGESALADAYQNAAILIQDALESINVEE